MNLQDVLVGLGLAAVLFLIVNKRKRQKIDQEALARRAEIVRATAEMEQGVKDLENKKKEYREKLNQYRSKYPNGNGPDDRTSS